MKKLLVSVIFIVLFSNFQAQEDLSLSGKLVKKHYPAPHIVKRPAFGWYLELSKESQKEIKKQFKKLSEEDRRIFKELKIDLQTVQCVEINDNVLIPMRSLDGMDVTIEGKLESPCLSRKYLCFSITSDAVASKTPVGNLKSPFVEDPDCLSHHRCNESEFYDDNETFSLLQLPEGEPEKIVTLRGKLILRLFAGPPEYISIENGDRADYCWLLQMDEESFKIATTTQVPEPCNDLKSIMAWSNHDELYLSMEEDLTDFCCDHEGRDIAVQGYLFHSHTAHHHSPILMDVKKMFSAQAKKE